jgi:hypothetical protein
VKAAIAMSPPVPRDAVGNNDRLDRVYAHIHIPCLHMTGTLDEAVIGDTPAADRRLPFDHIPAGSDQYLVTFKDGDHMIFSGRTRQGPLAGNGPAEKDPMFQDLIRQSTTAFWDAYLRDDAKARAWLSQGGFARALAADGKLEMKVK